MDKVDLFMKAEKERMGKIPIPPHYDRALEAALAEAGLSGDEIKKAIADHGAAGSDEGKAHKGGEAQRKARRWFWIPAAAACAVLFFALHSFLPFTREAELPQELPESFQGVIAITPLLGAEDRVDPYAGFLITSSEALPKGLVEKALTVEPAFEYELTAKKGGKEYEIVPVIPLAQESVYRIAFDPENSLADLRARGAYTWAFQTKGKFSLKGTMPAANSSMVPVSASIELHFTAPPDIADLESIVTIAPRLPGQWIAQNNNAVFLPEQPMAYKTLYQIDIAEGIRGSGGAGMTESGLTVVFHTENAPGQSGENQYFELDGQNLAFRSDEAPSFRFYYNDWVGGEEAPPPEVAVSLFSFANDRDYQKALVDKTKDRDWLYGSEGAQVPAEGLTGLAEYILAGQKIEYSWYVYLPDMLPKGFYLAVYQFQGQTRQMLFQITDLCAYLSANEREALLWVHDLSTGAAAPGAEIRVNGEFYVSADAAGAAYISNLPSDSKVRLYHIRYGQEQILLADVSYTYGQPDRQQWHEQRRTAQSYWNYLYVDKPIYRPGDKLFFFGLAAPRDPNAQFLRDVTLRLENYRMNLDISQSCAVVDDIYQGDFTLPVLTPGYYNISMYIGDAFVCASYFEVALYEKPAYRITLTADKKIALKGDTVYWTASTAFFDGTPLPEQPISFYGSAVNGERVITSDVNGEITFSTKADGGDYGLLGSDHISAVAVMPEMGEVYRESQITVFTGDIELTGKASRLPAEPFMEENMLGDPEAGGDAGEAVPDGLSGPSFGEPLAAGGHYGFRVDLEAFDVDISRIAEQENSLFDQALAPYGGPVLLEASLIRQYWHAVETGQRYDPYTKQTVPIVEYRLEEIPESTFRWNYAGPGVATYSEGLHYPDAYRLDVSYRDRAGRRATRSFYLPEASVAGQEDGYLRNQFFWLRQDNGEQYCRLGEVAAYNLYSGDSIVTREGHFLFFRAKDAIKDYIVSEENRYAFLFDEKELAGSNIMGVFFDGQRYYTTNSFAGAVADPAERALRVTAKADKDRYFPGERVELDLQLTDHRGQPAKGVINLNLVDEALLALRDQQADIGRQVFLSNRYDFDYQVTISHPSSEGGGMAEGGEGDGSRSDFRDTVLFRMLYTDQDGRIHVAFDLPDNITSWRLIWQAYTRDIRVGSGWGAIAVGLPFFADIRFNGPILENDEPALGLRAAGSAVPREPAPDVSWTVNIPEMDFSQTFSGQAFSWKDMQLPAMAEGDYTLQAHCVWGQYSDSVTQFFRVLKSRQSFNAREEGQLAPGYRIPGSDQGMTTVVFSDANWNKAIRGLHELAGQESIRMEQRIAALESRKLLKTLFGLNWWGLTDTDERSSREQILRYQSFDGGVAYLPYAESDLYASVWAASVGADYFSREELAYFFQTILEESNDPSVDLTMALWGAAACNRPVLADIRRALQENSYQGQDLTGQQRLNLLCAMIFIGNGNEALPYAEELLRGWTEDLSGLYRASIGRDRTETLKATAQMAVVASVLDMPQSAGLYRYILENQSDEEYFLLEKLLCLRSACSKLAEPAGFSYVLDGEEKAVDLSKTAGYTLTLLPEQRQSLEVTQVNGQIIAESQYQQEGYTEPLDIAGQMQVSRVYKVSGQEAWSLPMSGKLQVEIRYRIEEGAPDGCYNIIDYLPAGLRYVSLSTEENALYGHSIWLLKEEGNRLSFGVYKSREAMEGVLLYNVRVAMPGSYLAEPAMLAHSAQAAFFVSTEGNRVYIN